MEKRRDVPVEVRERTMRTVAEHRELYPSEWAAITSVSEKLGIKAETLRKWLRRAEVDEGARRTGRPRSACREMRGYGP
jgi:transposase